MATAILEAVRNNTAVLPVSPEAWVGWYVKRWFPHLARWLGANPLPFMK